MNIHGLQVSSSSVRDILRLERSLQHLAKKEEAKFDLAIACYCFSLLDTVCLLSLWFSFCGRFFGAYWHFLSVETACKLFKMFLQQMGNRITILGSIKHPTPRMAKNLFMLYFNPYALGARLHPTISPSLKRNAILSFYLKPWSQIPLRTPYERFFFTIT